MTQPTVLVKRNDGTYVRMTLGELENLRGQKHALSKVEGSKVESRKSDSGRAWSKDDAKSLLEDIEEAVEAFQPGFPAVSRKRIDQVEEVMRNKGFQVPQQLVDRLRGTMQLRLKDIRSEDETKEILVRSVKEGGLGLTEPQADTVIRLCAGVQQKEAKKVANLNNTLQPAISKNELPEIYHEPGLPATAAPFNAFKYSVAVDQSPYSARSVVPPYGSRILTPPHPPHSGERQSGNILNSQSSKKVVINDITAPPLEMGPVEEIRYMTLTEFRRLSSNPAEAASRLKQKILTIKDESFLLYMDAHEAWRNSPLYMQYIKKVIEALTKGKPLSSVLVATEGIRLEEIKEIIKMERDI